MCLLDDGEGANGFNSITNGCKSLLKRGPSLTRLAECTHLRTAPLESGKKSEPWQFNEKSVQLTFQEHKYHPEDAKIRIGHLYKQHVLDFLAYCYKVFKLQRLKTFGQSDRPIELV